MAKQTTPPVIRLRGVRHNNLKNFDLDLPLRRLIVITGLSGSGKSSLAFDTLFAEGQRRYIETFSPYARQFFDRMDKPQVDRIEGIPPAIAIEQRNTVRTTRSTVGTMTELCDYMKLLWPHLAQLHCRQCGQPVQKDTPQLIWQRFRAEKPGGEQQESEALVTFDLSLSEKISLSESLALIAKQGYQRLLFPSQPPEILRLDEALPRLEAKPPTVLTIVQDRLRLNDANRARFVEACEHAYHFGKGKLAIHLIGARTFLSAATRDTTEANGTSEIPIYSDNAADKNVRAPRLLRFSNRLHCAQCDLEYREPSSALFSFNHPVGACPTSRGFGRIISIDYNLAIPDRSKTLAQGAIKPWQSGVSAECQDDLLRACRKAKISTDVPFENLSKRAQDFIVDGAPGYGKDAAHQWPHAWYGVKGYFRWLESKAYKMHVRVLLSRYRAYSPCPDCHGKRFQPEVLLYRVTVPPSLVKSNAAFPLTPALSPGERENRFQSGREIDGSGLAKNLDVVLPLPEGEGEANSALSLADFYQLPISEALQFIERVRAAKILKPSDAIAIVLQEIRSRLGYLVDVGLGYLTLDRPTRTLSGGETERVNLTTCLGTRLVNTLFVLDEPSVGLHARDTARLVRILENLRDAGNTVVVVEHEAAVMRAADQLVDLGPGQGEAGGRIVFQGPYQRILRSRNSLTGQYLSRKKRIEVPPRRQVNLNGQNPKLVLTGASRHNLKNLSVQIPLNRLVVITGVSGSGKTTLAREILLPALQEKFKLPAATSAQPADPGDDDSPPDSTAPSARVSGHRSLGDAVLVDQSPLGKTPRSNPAVYIGAFDDLRELFARTELARQRGLGPSAFSFNSSQGQCETCRGAGFEKIEMQFLSDVFIRCPACNGRRYRPHILEIKINGMSDPATPITRHPTRSTRAWSIADTLEATVDEVVRFLATLSDSAHAQRAIRSLKLLQEVGLGYLRLGQPINTLSGGESQRLKLVRHLADFAQSATAAAKPTLFVFDEPTTGLHFDDVRVLLKVFQRFVDAGHSVIIIEHNLDVIQCADWLIDLGPEAGEGGGRIVAQGTPEETAACEESHTGKALRELCKHAKTPSRKVAKHSFSASDGEKVAGGG